MALGGRLSATSTSSTLRDITPMRGVADVAAGQLEAKQTRQACPGCQRLVVLRMCAPAPTCCLVFAVLVLSIVGRNPIDSGDCEHG